jgi:hypothetical protein
VLGEYEVLYRVLPVRVRLSLQLGETILNAGDSPFATIENRGTLGASFSYRYILWKGAGRGGPNIPLEYGSMSNDIPRVPAGMRGSCFNFRLPETLVPGPYTVGIKTRPEGAPKRIISKSFQVAPDSK